VFRFNELDGRTPATPIRGGQDHKHNCAKLKRVGKLVGADRRGDMREGLIVLEKLGSKGGNGEASMEGT